MRSCRAPLAPILRSTSRAFAAIALNCHGDLSNDRPEASPLTEFYFWVSFGGMLGGLFNTLVAPLLFNSIVEYPLVVLLACLLFRTADSRSRPPPDRVADVGVPLAVGGADRRHPRVLTRRRGAPLALQLAALSVPALLTFAQRRQRGAIRLGDGGAAGGEPGLWQRRARRVLYATRTFFGVYRVSEDLAGRYHGLAHGTTLHGMQALAPERRGEALTYYHRDRPVRPGVARRCRAPRRRRRSRSSVSASARSPPTRGRRSTGRSSKSIRRSSGSRGRREYFSFLDACGDRCRVVIGDARISLARVPEHAYDLLVLDAFSSDSIPMHLMTREAFALYLSRLAPDGALVMHISNRHLRLAPVVARLAAESGAGRAAADRGVGPGWPEGKNASHWIVMARTQADLDAADERPRWPPLVASPSTPLWTDDFSNILSVLSVR